MGKVRFAAVLAALCLGSMLCACPVRVGPAPIDANGVTCEQQCRLRCTEQYTAAAELEACQSNCPARCNSPHVLQVPLGG
jgi:hypothetical protein